MKLKHAEKTIAYPMLRLISENNIWEMGIYPTIYGTRVSCGRVGSQSYLKGGYCCGTNPDLIVQVFGAVAIILGSMDESIREYEARKIFPDWERRPIDLDDGFDKLKQVACSRVKEPITPLETIVSEGLAAIAQNVNYYRSKAHQFIFENL